MRFIFPFCIDVFSSVFRLLTLIVGRRRDRWDFFVSFFPHTCMMDLLSAYLPSFQVFCIFFCREPQQTLRGCCDSWAAPGREWWLQGWTDAWGVSSRLAAEHVYTWKTCNIITWYLCTHFYELSDIKHIYTSVCTYHLKLMEVSWARDPIGRGPQSRHGDRGRGVSIYFYYSNPFSECLLLPLPVCMLIAGDRPPARFAVLISLSLPQTSLPPPACLNSENIYILKYILSI